ncbi:transcription elongation factor, mitochondrial [Denticeps clupeoides]|uniref:Transcription elongation factor, mitochondrial n=1 Tax=Denticeps clupeoides TaxID=299321 RepID=A0AAY4AK87_9TELE|nr:transcription elongation factor, mitochondrial [Denticeps clupeoides]
MWLFRRLFLSSALVTARRGLRPEVKPRYRNCSRVPMALTSDPCGDDDDKPLDARYSAEQRAVILRLLNTAAESELAAVKLLRGRKLASVVDYRARYGPFPDLQSVTNVPLLKHRSAVTVFNSILRPDDKRDKRKARGQLAKFIRPEVERKQLEEATSIVSIVFGTNKIAWTHMDRAMSVLDWQQEECSSFMNGTYMASSYLDDISEVVSRLPDTDFFVVEKPGVSLQNTALYPVMVHLRTVEAMLFALLSTRQREPGDPPKVLNMMRTAVGRHFGLIVGESRTSGAQAVRQMMTDSVTKKAPRVTFPHDLLVKYRSAFHMGSRNRGEELCDALLQAVAFYELLGE